MFFTVFTATLSALFVYHAIVNLSYEEWDRIYAFVWKNLIAITVFGLIVWLTYDDIFGLIEFIFSLIIAFITQFSIKFSLNTLKKIMPKLDAYYLNFSEVVNKHFSIDIIIPKNIRGYLSKLEKQGGSKFVISWVIKYLIGMTSLFFFILIVILIFSLFL